MLVPVREAEKANNENWFGFRAWLSHGVLTDHYAVTRFLTEQVERDSHLSISWREEVSSSFPS
jgi:hypothetical protein